MKVTTALIRELREMTGAGVLEAKKTLEEANGNLDRAADLLREKGAARAEKRSDRTAREGVIEVYSHPGERLGVILELNCETDFVARNALFKDLAHDIALHIAAMNPLYLSAEEVPQKDLDRETSVLSVQAASEGKPQAIIDKIVAGRIRKFYEDTCLLEQPFVKDEKTKVGALITEAIRATGENIIIRRFERFELGEML